MSHGRRRQGSFFARAINTQVNLQDYPADLIENVINVYINRRIKVDGANEKTSEGIQRAKILIHHIQEELIKERQFTALQIMWIMFDYATRCDGTWLLDPGAAPLYSSETLREMILKHFCRCFGITNKKIEQVEEAMSEDMSREHPSHLGLHIQLHVESHEAIRLALIKNKLQAMSSEVCAPSVVTYANKLHQDLLVYMTSVKDKWSKSAGRERAEKIKKIIDEQWLNCEKLSELQLMWRVWEQLSLAKKESHGVFGSSHDCRLQIIRGMCEYLEIQEQVSQALHDAPDFHMTMQVGFTYIDTFEDDEEKEMRISLQAIANSLRQQRELQLEDTLTSFGNSNNRF